MYPFLEAGDDSADGLDRLWRATVAVGWLDEARDGNRESLRRALMMASRSPAEAGLDLRNMKNPWQHHDVAWSFTGWLHRTKGLAWSSTRFLADALEHYWEWHEDGKKPTSAFGLNKARLDHYLAQKCRSFFSLDGVRALSTLQAFHYFTEYLAAHDYFSAVEAGRLQTSAADFYERIGRVVDKSDAGYQFCPTYQALITQNFSCPRGLDCGRALIALIETHVYHETFPAFHLPR